MGVAGRRLLVDGSVTVVGKALLVRDDVESEANRFKVFHSKQTVGLPVKGNVWRWHRTSNSMLLVADASTVLRL